MIFALLVLAGGAAVAQDDPAAYAVELARLRGEVAELATELETGQDALRGEARSLSAQKAELELQIRREDVRLERLKAAADAEHEALSAGDSEGGALVEVVRAGIVRLRASVEAGPPFRVDERLAALDELEARLDDGSLRPQEVAARLWQIAEDELRLNRENTLDRQVIEIDGEERLSEVAKLGMVALYYRTDDGRVGYAAREGGGWTWREITDRGGVQQVDELFDALGKQIRTGFFEVPNALSGGTR